MNEFQGLHTILISNNYDAVYSGLTPLYLKNKLKKKDISIDLQRLCFNAGATFIKDEVLSINPSSKEVFLKKYPKFNYDILSINSGSISNNKKIKIEKNANYFFVKPINFFLENLNKIDEIIYKNEHTRLSVIGNGIAGYEIAYNLKERYKKKIDINLIGPRASKENNINTNSYKKLKKIAIDLNITEYDGRVEKIDKNFLTLDNGKNIKSDINLLSTGVNPPDWFQKNLLSKDLNGFGVVNQSLQSVNEENIFITGDLATIQNHERPRSGVMAVRHGEVLKENIFLKLQNKPLKKIYLQRNWLYIVNTYNDKSLLNYYFFTFHNKWCTKLKFFIDINFMNKFKFPNKIFMKKKILTFEEENKNNQTMYCQGCGSKVAKKTLISFLKNDNKNQELSDCLVVNFKSKSILQTIDHIKLFSSFNPFDFGVISYFHSQNDILAGGGSVKSLSVSLGVPFSEGIIESFFLEFFMEGIKKAANEDGATIASGHSYLSNEPGITITMNGSIERKLSKTLAKSSNLIYLSKSLGTGYLLSAYFKNSESISSEDFEKLVKHLKKSNKNAYKAAYETGCKAITDISGFGLGSHLMDICKISNLCARLKLSENCLINSNLNLLKLYKSTGYENNYEASHKFMKLKENSILNDILFDPQTNGPLLMVVEKDKKEFFEEKFIEYNHYKPLLIGSFENNLRNNHYVLT